MLKNLFGILLTFRGKLPPGTSIWAKLPELFPEPVLGLLGRARDWVLSPVNICAVCAMKSVLNRPFQYAIFPCLLSVPFSPDKVAYLFNHCVTAFWHHHLECNLSIEVLCPNPGFILPDCFGFLSRNRIRIRLWTIGCQEELPVREFHIPQINKGQVRFQRLPNMYPTYYEQHGWILFNF